MRKPNQNNSGTYTVQNGSSQEDLERLLIHDQMFTSAMGGVLSEQPDPMRFQRVLDIGCGFCCHCTPSDCVGNQITRLRFTNRETLTHQKSTLSSYNNRGLQ